MGLSHNELYKPSKHFKQRLKKRFNVNDWKQFMNSCYSKMYKDDERTKWAIPPATAWSLNQPVVYQGYTYHPIILLDETEHKLLTIYHDMDEMEKSIEENIHTDSAADTQPDVEDIDSTRQYEAETDNVSELEAFALQLHKEQDDFRKKCEYKYAQKVLQQNQEPFEAFIHCYHRILTGNATQQNKQLMDEFKALIEPINNIIQNLELK